MAKTLLSRNQASHPIYSVSNDSGYSSPGEPNEIIMPIIYDCDPCCDNETTVALFWDIHGECYPTGTHGFYWGCHLDSAGNLVADIKSNGSPVDQFWYRSTMKDMTENVKGTINFNLNVDSLSYKLYVRAAPTHEELYRTPFRFYTPDQEVEGRYYQVHLIVKV